MQSITESILQTIQHNSEWAWAFVFLIAFVESLAIFGIFMPGWVLLVGVGTMIGADILEFLPIVTAAYIGAVLGEYLSFHVGYHYHEKIVHWPIVAKRQHLIDRSKAFFEKHGAAGVFFGRFIGPVRAVIPLIAGISEMPKKTFLWVNLTSGVCWAPLYLIPGILVGAAFELDKELSTSLLFILLILGIILWIAIQQSRLILNIHRGLVNRNIRFSIINALLAWGIFFVAIVLISKSRYYDFLKTIFNILWSRIA